VAATPPGSTTGPASSGLFKRVSVDRASQVIVDQIRQLVRNKSLKPGDRLPSERQLCEEFGVSRVTVREALRILEASGLISIRVGAQGGAFLTTPTPEVIGEGLADLINLSPLTGSNVTEARMIFEISMLPLVVERATDDDVDQLFELVDQAQEALSQGHYTMDQSAAFHIRVAASTHNPAIEMLVRSFHGPLLMSLREAQVAAPLMGQRGTEEHRALTEAIRRRDVAAATAVMREHLQRTQSRLDEADETGEAEWVSTD
jgi:DNA-binding FadR family transcriptional regulator